MNRLTEEQKKRFNSQKRNWELYGSLGMGIAYPKLEQFLADELAMERELIIKAYKQTTGINDDVFIRALSQELKNV